MSTSKSKKSILRGWLHINAAAEILDVTPGCLRQEASQGRIPEEARVKIGGHNFFRRAWVFRRKKHLEKIRDSADSPVDTSVNAE